MNVGETVALGVRVPVGLAPKEMVGVTVAVRVEVDVED